jgi:hypothetical protein
MYGLENLFSQGITAVGAPALSSFVKEGTGDMIASGLSGLDLKPDTLKLLGDIGSGTLGALSGAALGAGLGALTGGQAGAAGGAATGLLSGGWGAYKSKDIQGALGNPMTQQGVANTGFGVTPEQLAKPQAFGVSNQQLAGQNASSPIAEAFNKPIGEMPSEVTAPTAVASTPAEAAPASSDVDLEKYFDIAGKGALPAFTLGSGIGSNMALSDYMSEQEQQLQQKRQQEAAKLAQLTQGLYNSPGYADGGALEIHPPNTDATIRFPEWFLEDYQRSGGLAALKDRFANGGFIHTQPIDPNAAYPQSQIARATPYPAASPQRSEVVDHYEHGGLLEGDGDGMSDDIPANISGQEDVRVADGEYVVPKKIAESMEAKLDRMLTAVRSAAHPHKGKQIIQDAAKKAFIHAMTGVKA